MVLTTEDKEQLQTLNSNGQAVIVNGLGKKRKLETFGLSRTAVFRQVYMVVLANLSVLSTGMALGYPAITLEQLTDPKEPITLSPSQASWFASINAIACPVGGLLSGFLLDKIGRKKMIFTINLTAIISWGIMALTMTADSEVAFIQIMISRFIIGIATGLASSPAGVYSAEVCHPNLRGRLTLGTSISTAAGIFVIYVLGYFIRDNWKLVSGIICVYSIIAFVLSIQIRESPSWLITKRRYEEAEESLKYFRGLSKNESNCDEFEDEYDRLLKSLSTGAGQKKERIVSMLKRPEVYKPVLIMVSFFAFQQFSGIFVVIVYAVNFSIEAGVSIDPILCAILIGLTRTVTTFLVGYILDKWGRRPPALVSGTGMTVCMFLLAATTWFPSINVPYLPVICIVVYIFTSTLGLMTLPFSMISEVYPQKVRGAAAGITICCGYLMSFVSIKTYPTMVEEIRKENVFAFYGAVSFLAVIFVYVFLPETKGKSLQEIEEYFRNGSRKDTHNRKQLGEEMKEISTK